MVLASVGPWTARGIKKAAFGAVDIISSTTILGVGLKRMLGVKFAISREEGDAATNALAVMFVGRLWRREDDGLSVVSVLGQGRLVEFHEGYKS